MPTLVDIQNRNVKLTGNKLLPTLKVRRKADNRVVIINVAMFDDVLYEELGKGEDASTVKEQSAADRLAEQNAAQERMAAVAEENAAHKYGKTEMATMKVEAIKKLAEWQRIPAASRDKARTKQAVIDLIFSHRL